MRCLGGSLGINAQYCSSNNLSPHPVRACCCVNSSTDRGQLTCCLAFTPQLPLSLSPSLTSHHFYLPFLPLSPTATPRCTTPTNDQESRDSSLLVLVRVKPNSLQPTFPPDHILTSTTSNEPSQPHPSSISIIMSADTSDLTKVDSAIGGMASSPPKEGTKRRTTSSAPGVMNLNDLGS